ncbi:unnamed protein product [Closterium sp. Naga37s-1]|nr:unnamed protein product [Closterium sp. Naga37s-1]
MQALADSTADDTASEPPSSLESLDEGEFLSSVAHAVGSRKRKAAEIEEVPFADAPVEGGSEESEVTCQLRRAIAAVILRGSGAGGPCPALGAASSDVPSPPAAAPLPIVTTLLANPADRTLTHGPLPMPFRLPIANVAAEVPMGQQIMMRMIGCNDRQIAGECIKARSMAERQRWERISEGLQKLQLVVRGHGDTATMLEKAVA